MNRNQNKQMVRVVWHLTLAAMILLVCITTAHAQNDICFTNIGGLGGTPTIDGIVEGFTTGSVNVDPGWNNATRFNLSGDNGSTTATKLMVGRSGGFVYLAFVVNWSSLSANQADTIVIALSTTTNAAEDWRIHIKPFDTGIADGSNIVPAVTYWRNSGDWNNAGGGSPVTTAPGFWMKDRTRVSKDGQLWAVEMQIPIATIAGSNMNPPTGIFFPASGNFELYADVLSTDNLTGTVSQSPFPAGRIIVSGASTFLNRNTPTRPWGTASLNDRSECTGITLNWSDIGVVNPSPPGNIVHTMRRFAGPFSETNMAACAAHPENFQFPGTKGPPNTFIARPFNGMSANKPVNVTFFIASWGVPGLTWGKIGKVPGGAEPPLGVTPSNPTANQTITAGLKDKDFTTIWELSYRWSCLYSFRPHQCMRVDVDSSDPSVIIKNKSVERNMDFVPASTFQRKAYISGDQGPLPPGSAKHQFVILVETDQQGAISGDDVQGRRGTRTTRLHSDELASLARQQFPRQTTNLAVWIARAFFKTGKTLNIDGRDYQIVERAGDFGYVAGHAGAITGWNFDFTGTGLTKVSNNVYTIEVGPNDEAEVETTIEAVEAGVQQPGGFKRWGLSLHAGASIPHGDFDTFFNPGPNVGFDLEYRLHPLFSLEGIYTYHRFNGDNFGGFNIPDVNLHQVSVNGKLYGNTSPVRWFVNGGGGVYHFDPSSTNGGINVGGGVQFDVTPNFAVDAMYNFNNVFTSGTNTKFSTVQAGVRWRF